LKDFSLIQLISCFDYTKRLFFFKKKLRKAFSHFIVFSLAPLLVYHRKWINDEGRKPYFYCVNHDFKPNTDKRFIP